MFKIKVSASALVVIDNVFHKVLNTHKGFFKEKLHGKFLFVYTSVPPKVQSVQPFLWKSWDRKNRGKLLGWWRLSIWFSTSSSLTKVPWQKGPMCHHKYLNVQALQHFHQVSWYKRDRGIWDDLNTSQKSSRTPLYSVC